MMWIYYLIILVAVCFFGLGVRIVRPTHKMLVETLGKYKRTAQQGFSWIIPIIQSGRYVNITEQMADARKQDVITKDRLNTTVDAVIFFKVKSDEKNVKASQYNVFDYKEQIVTKARIALRNIIGDMKYEEANSNRNKINKELQKAVTEEVKNWGVEVSGAEMKEIDPPKDVQASMNQLIKAENEKNAAGDFAEAVETKADGEKRASIKEAEGQKQSSILVAEGKAKAFKLIQTSFKGNAQKLKQMEVTEASLKNNSKVILTDKGIKPQLLIGSLPIAK